MSVKLGVPSKGRLMEKTFGWFAERGLDMRRSGSDREWPSSDGHSRELPASKRKDRICAASICDRIP